MSRNLQGVHCLQQRPSLPRVYHCLQTVQPRRGFACIDNEIGRRLCWPEAVSSSKDVTHHQAGLPLLLPCVRGSFDHAPDLKLPGMYASVRFAVVGFACYTDILSVASTRHGSRSLSPVANHMAIALYNTACSKKCRWFRHRRVESLGLD